jgi:hypothetical protein
MAMRNDYDEWERVRRIFAGTGVDSNAGPAGRRERFFGPVSGWFFGIQTDEDLCGAPAPLRRGRSDRRAVPGLAHKPSGLQEIADALGPDFEVIELVDADAVPRQLPAPRSTNKAKAKGKPKPRKRKGRPERAASGAIVVADVFDVPFDDIPGPLSASPAPGRGARRTRTDFDAIAQTIEFLEADPGALPQPIGPPGYRPTECAADGDPWGMDYQEAVAEATERAALEAGDDEQTFRRLLRAYLSEHVRFAEWAEIERGCVADFRRRRPRATRRRLTATDETLSALEALERETGESIRGTAAHLDMLTPWGRATYWRRDYKKTGAESSLRRAKEIEAQIRASQRRGGGPKGHRA